VIDAGRPSEMVDFAELRESLVPLTGSAAPWRVAGGGALDLFLGRVTRSHADVDVAVLRRDQLAVQRHLADWALRWVRPVAGGVFHPWREDEWLELPVHEIHGRNDAGATIEILLNEARGEEWHFRRDVQIHRPLSLVGRNSLLGIPYLAPEVVLLYTAENPRPSDEEDFTRLVDHLSAEQRAWLSRAIATSDGVHPWLAAL
jgi:hypothetical protein